MQCDICFWNNDGCIVFDSPEDVFKKKGECSAKITQREEFLHKYIDTIGIEKQKKLTSYIYNNL